MRVLLIPILLGLAALGQEAESPSDTTQTGTASIEGTVVNSVTNEPIKKAQVMLMGAPTPGMHQPPTAITDASGAFSFLKLPPGAYTVQASHNSYSSTRDMILGDNQKQIVVTADQHVAGVTLRLTPGGAISGHLIDEYGDPAENCQVMAVPPGQQPQTGRGRLYAASTDDRGEYRISGMPAGRYSVFERCHSTLAAPHGFLPRGDARIPELVFVPEFYGGTPTSKGASMVSVQAGSETQGIDFRLKTANAIAVRIAIASDQPFNPRQLQVELIPPGATYLQFDAFRDQQSGAFMARGITPGTYTVLAVSLDEDAGLYGETEANISDAARTVAVQLGAPMALTGSVQFAGDSKTDPGRLRDITLIPLDQNRGLRFPRTQINKDGTFTLTGVMPGRFMVQVDGMGAAIRSATLAQHEISPYGFEIGEGAGGPLNIVLSSKQVPVTITIDGSDSSRTASILAIPVGSDDSSTMMPQNISNAQTQGTSAQLSLAPGKYNVYAVECNQVWAITNEEGLWSAISGRGKPLEVRDDAAGASISVDLITRDDLRYALTRESQ